MLMGFIKKHGLINTPEYRAWGDMKGRCANMKHSDYRLYGARGITVCLRWQLSFTDFLSDVGQRPSGYYSIDRFPDKNGNYEPGNVRWATPREQQANTRQTRPLHFQGETLTIREWAERTGIGQNVIRRRLCGGWTVERTLTQLPGRRVRKPANSI